MTKCTSEFRVSDIIHHHHSIFSYAFVSWLIKFSCYFNAIPWLNHINLRLVSLCKHNESIHLLTHSLAPANVIRTVFGVCCVVFVQLRFRFNKLLQNFMRLPLASSMFLSVYTHNLTLIIMQVPEIKHDLNSSWLWRSSFARVLLCRERQKSAWQIWNFFLEKFFFSFQFGA